MKKLITSAAALVAIAVQAQVKDSTKTSSIEEVQLRGKYYRTYTKKNASGSLRLETPLINVSQNIQVITKDAMADQQITGISDGILRNVSGATRLEHWADLYARINMRGSRAAAFMNGVNVTSNWGPLAEDMSYADRIEFVKGPAGFMMSNGEPSGLYNIVTKKPIFNEGVTGSAGITTGSYSLYRAETDVNVPLSSKLAFRLNLMGQNKKSFRKNEFNNRYIVAPSISYKISDNTVLTAEYIYQKAIMSEVGSSYVFSTKGYKEFPVDFTMTDAGLPDNKITEHYINLHLITEISPEWKLTSQVSYMSDYQLGGDIWPTKILTDGRIQRNYSGWEGKNEMKFAQIFLNGNVKTGNVSHKILTGLDIGDKLYLADWNQSGLLDTEEKPFNPYVSGYQAPSAGYPKFDFTSTPLKQRANPFGTIKQNYSGVYLQDEIGFLEDKLRLTLAGRLTDVSQSSYGGDEQTATNITPRAGISASIMPNFSAYALYDQAFIPQAGFLRDGGKIKPITGSNIEFGLKKDWLNGRFNSTISVYKITKQNELVSDPNDQGSEKFSIVKGESVAKGVELDTKGELAPGFNMIVNYAFTDNEVTKSNIQSLKVGDKVAGYAKHNFNSWLNYEIQNGMAKGLGASLGFSFQGDRTSWNWNNDSIVKKMDDYKKWDAGVFWGNKKVKIVLNVFNLMNTYIYSGSPYLNYFYYQAEAPRNYRLSVNYKF